MSEFITSTMVAVKRYTTLDFALFKICLLAIGVLFGVNLNNFFSSYILLVWAVAIISYILIMYKTFVTYRK